MKTCVFKYTEKFNTKKKKKKKKKKKIETFQINNSDIFHIAAKNKNCGFSLESH